MRISRGRLHGKPRETREYLRGSQIPLKLLAGLHNTFRALGDISKRVIEIPGREMTIIIPMVPGAKHDFQGGYAIQHLLDLDSLRRELFFQRLLSQFQLRYYLHGLA